MSFTIVELGGARHPVAVGGDGFDAAAHEVEHFRQLAFDDRPHRVELVIEAASVDQVEAAGDVGADAFTLAKRGDAEL